MVLDFPRVKHLNIDVVSKLPDEIGQQREHGKVVEGGLAKRIAAMQRTGYIVVCKASYSGDGSQTEVFLE